MIFSSCAFILITSLLLSNRFFIIKIASLFFIISLSTVWYIANDFTGNGMDDSFLYTISNSITGTPILDNLKYIIIIFVTLSIFIASIFFSKKINNKTIIFDSIFILTTLIYLIYSEPAVNLMNLLSAKKNISDVNNEYIINSNIVNSINGNYIIILAESLEHSFKDIDGVNYLRNITKLDNQVSFSNIGYVRGSGWTIAGHVSFICGVPLIGTGNSAGKIKTFLPKATCFSDIISNAGYMNIYLSGTDINFAGTRNFLESHSFSSIIDKNILSKKYPEEQFKTKWGIDDKVVFDEAFNIFVDKSKLNKPFSLFVSTINTHSPGHTSFSCDTHIDDSYLNSVICADKTIAEFISKVQHTEYYDNTTIILISDHGLMHWESLIGKRMHRSNLFSVFHKNLRNEIVNTEGTVLDQLPTALEVVSRTKSELGFGRSIYSENRSLGKLNDTHNDFARSLWAYPSMYHKIRFNNKNQVEIGSVKFSLPLCVYFKDDKLIEFGYEDGFYQRCLDDISHKSDKNIFVAKKCGDKICSIVYKNFISTESDKSDISNLFH